jgi:hypothetical protein
LGVTKGQWDKLDALPQAPPVKWPQAERDRFATMALAWETTAGDARTDAAAALVKALGAFAKEKRAADEKVMADRVKGVREILTAAQMKKVNPIPRWDLKPATAPATKSP